MRAQVEDNSTKSQFFSGNLVDTWDDGGDFFDLSGDGDDDAVDFGWDDGIDEDEKGEEEDGEEEAKDEDGDEGEGEGEGDEEENNPLSELMDDPATPIPTNVIEKNDWRKGKQLTDNSAEDKHVVYALVEPINRQLLKSCSYVKTAVPTDVDPTLQFMQRIVKQATQGTSSSVASTGTGASGGVTGKAGKKGSRVDENTSSHNTLVDSLLGTLTRTPSPLAPQPSPLALRPSTLDPRPSTLAPHPPPCPPS